MTVLLPAFSAKRIASYLLSFFAVATSLATAAVAQTTSTNIQITSAVAQPAVHRLGVNLGDQVYWDSGQMLKNLIFQNPGFEGLQYRTILHCKTTSANSCTDDNGYNASPTGYWNGGSYRVITGSALGATGKIVASTKNPTSCGSCGPVIQFDKSVNMAVGDYVTLTNYFPGGGEQGWWPTAAGGGAYTTETTDISPESPGKQAMLLSASGSGQSASMDSYFDSTAGISFIQLNGNFQITFRAKGVGGKNQLNVGLARMQPGLAPYLSQTVTLTNTWQDYSLTFSANETGSALGTVQLMFQVAGSSIELDDVSMEQTNSNPSNTTVFRDDVVNALKQLNPGTIRMMASGAALGSDIPNQLATPFARYRSGFNADQTSVSEVAYGIDEFMHLCATVNADPWITIPTATTPAEMTALIEYMTGNGSDQYSASRIARGQSAAWTTVFNKIHIELGNETWNGVFKGESMLYPGYPQWANTVFGTARQTSGYVASKFDLVLDGWASDPGYNGIMLGYSTQHDSIDMAPYLLYSANNEAQSTMFGALFAEPEMFESATGEVFQNMQIAATATHPTAVSVYETNLGTELGNITQTQLNALTPSVGAGIASADHMLQMMRAGVQYQNTFALQQYQYRRSDSSLVKLWGIVLDMGNTNRRRPQFLTQALSNSVIGGNMLQTVQSGSNPTWNQPLSSDNVQLNGAHYLQSFAFLNGSSASTVLFNLSQTASLPVTFSGANAPSGTVTMTRITSANITDNNETSIVVAPVTQTLSGFNAAAGLTLPPFSMTVLHWNSSNTQAPQFSLAAGAYSTSQSVTITDGTTGAAIYYTTDGSTPTTSSNAYTGAITVSTTETLSAIAVGANAAASAVSSAAYTIQPATPIAAVPVFTVAAGSYNSTQTVSITDGTANASIYYTTDGSTPTTASTLYTGAIKVASTETLKAIATAKGFSNSAVSAAAYVISTVTSGVTATPVFSIAGGTFNAAQTLTMSDATAGAAIYYTTNGLTPSTASTLYSGPITVNQSEYILALAIAPNHTISLPSAAMFSMVAATPTFSVAAGTYNNTQVVTVADATPGAAIYYTLNGSTPNTTSALYTGPITVCCSETLKVIAAKTGYVPSAVVTASYAILTATPAMNLAAGTYTSGQSLTLTDATAGATIYYTINGSLPSTSSTVYSGPIWIANSELVEAIAVKTGYSNSAVAAEAFTIETPTATPAFSVIGGTYTTAQTVAITDATAGAVIYYTTDATVPTTSSAVYTGPITVGSTEIVAAIAIAPGSLLSAIEGESYVITQTTVVDFAKGFVASQVHSNGSANITGTKLQLTSGLVGQGGSTWFPTPVKVGSFTTDFDFALPTSTGDGFTFAIQNEGAGVWALGGNAQTLAYQGITNSVAVAFTLHQSGVTNYEAVGVYTGGVLPEGTSVNLAGTGINLHNGDTFHIHIVYAGTTLAVTITDKNTGAAITEKFTVNVAASVGTGNAYVGFTGSTGGFVSTQNILNWTFAD